MSSSLHAEAKFDQGRPRGRQGPCHVGPGGSTKLAANLSVLEMPDSDKIVLSQVIQAQI